MNPELERLADRMAQLISGVSDSLHREMHEGFAHINERFDLMEARLDRQGGLLQTGSRWSARMTAWSERIDRILLDRDKKLVNLEERLRALEQKQNLGGHPKPAIGGHLKSGQRDSGTRH